MDTSKIPRVTLNNGLSMPQIGLGTFLSKEDDCYKAVKAAVGEHGYILVDTAAIYKNEE